MIIDGMGIWAVAKTLYDINKSVEMDEQALKKYGRAFERQEKAQLLVKKKSELADKRVANVAKKKRAIIQNTVPRFVEVYSQIQKIEIELSGEKNEITFANESNKIANLNFASIACKNEYTDKELICGLLTKGLGKTMQMDSERYMAAASSQMRASNVAYSQAESIAAIYDAIIGRADRISDLLMKMNALFVASISETEKTIDKNGLDVRNYTEYDKGVLMTCVDIAAAMSELINIPVVNSEGKLCDASIELLETGERYLAQMEKAVSNGI